MDKKIKFKKNGTEIGYGCVCDNEETGNRFIYDGYVDSKFRGNGYGSYIVKYMIKNYDVKELWVEENNIVAINLYTKFGFAETGKTYFNEDEQMNYIWMER